MELRHLRYFIAVAQHLNYSEASRRLHVAQPAVSQTILDFEEELGVKLLLRTKRGSFIRVHIPAFGNRHGLATLLSAIDSFLMRAAASSN